MSLTILKDEEIAGLLNSLSADELDTFRMALSQSLYEYSTGTQSVKDGDIQQPPRTSVTSPSTGATTLFMPSCSTDGIGVKVITLTKPAAKKEASAGPAGSDAVPAGPTIRPTGALTLYSEDGRPIGMLHASTLTAFRTALASACLLVRRDTVRDITVFGCGEQAYWHVRLALLLRGSTLRHVNIIGRRFAACKDFLARIYRLPTSIKEREGWATSTKFSILTTNYIEYERLLGENLRSSDAIFCCTPATEPLFDPTILTNHEGRRKGRLIVAIGSYTHDMQELPADLLRQATKPMDRTHVHYHKHAEEGGVIVVDTLEGALKEAGEVAEAGLTPRHLVELGELVMLARLSRQEEEEMSDELSTSSSTPSMPALDLGKLSMSGPAMSTVFNSQDSVVGSPVSLSSSTTLTVQTSADSSGRSSSRSRPSSPGRKSSSSSLLGTLRSRSSHRRSSSQASIDTRRKKDNQQARWLQSGNVIYKSVGLGLMDLSVGLHLIEFARQKGVGTRIEGF